MITKEIHQKNQIMKASEVVKRYQQGERNFRGVNLRGQSFKGQDLSGVDFSEADIRGTNFKGATLRGVQFRKAKAGLQKRWAITLVFVSLVFALLPKTEGVRTKRNKLNKILMMN